MVDEVIRLKLNRKFQERSGGGKKSPYKFNPLPLNEFGWNILLSMVILFDLKFNLVII